MKIAAKTESSVKLLQFQEKSMRAETKKVALEVRKRECRSEKMWIHSIGFNT